MENLNPYDCPRCGQHESYGCSCTRAEQLSAVRDAQADRIEELEAQLAEVTAERDAAIPRAYAMGVDAAAECIGHVTQSEDHEAIRALIPPADLVERVLKGGE